jgi:anti-sigma factor RsiW
MDHADLRQLAAGAALDDLDPTERAELDAHLARCSSCAALGAELDDVLADLALVAPEMRPPASLQADLLATIRAESPAPRVQPFRRPAPAGPVVPHPAWGGAPWRLAALTGLAAAAVLAVALAGLGMRIQSLGGELDTLRTALAADEAVIAVAANPDHRTASLHAPSGPSATVVWLPGTRDAWLVSRDLPATPSGRVYQLWHADGTGVHPLGTFSHDGSGTLATSFGVDLSESAAVMVTLEPVGGAQGEPGPEVVFGEL